MNPKSELEYAEMLLVASKEVNERFVKEAIGVGIEKERGVFRGLLPVMLGVGGGR